MNAKEALARFKDANSYALEACDLRKLASIMDRLYSEKRLSGDDMRDMAQTIHAVLSYAVELEEER